MGVPISNDRIMVGVNFKAKDEAEAYNKGLKEQTIAQQRAKMQTYQALVAEGLPVPPDLKAEVESVLGVPQDPNAAPPGGPSPGGLGGGPGGPPGGPKGPGGPGGGIVMPNAPPGLGASPDAGGPSVPGGAPPPATPAAPGPPGTVPDVSNERRPGLTYNTSVKHGHVEHEWTEGNPGKWLVTPDGVYTWNVDPTLGGPHHTEVEEDPYRHEFLGEIEPNGQIWGHGSDVPEGVVALDPAFYTDGHDEGITFSKKTSVTSDDESATMQADEELAELKLAAGQELVEHEGEEVILEKAPLQLETAEERKAKRHSFIDPDAVAPEPDNEE